MDTSQTKALAALEPFIQTVLSAKSPTPRFLADLIIRATSAQGTYIFTELLQLDQIQFLRSSAEFKSYLTLLEVFSWGTWEEYHANDGLPTLNESQVLKLRQLSLLTLAASPSFVMTYPNVMKQLSLSTTSELESLIMTTIYTGLIAARLSPTTNPPMVHITSTAPLRDLRPLSLNHLLKVLETWEGRCISVINDMESQIEGIQQAARKRATKEAGRDAALESAIKEAKNEGRDLSGGPATGNRSTATATTASKRIPAGFPVRTGGGHGKPSRGGHKRDLEDTEDDGDESFVDAHESSLGGDGMDIDDGGSVTQSAGAVRLAKRRGG